MFATIEKSLQNLVQLFFPHHCTGCGSDAVKHPQVLCAACIHRLPVTGFFEAAGNPVEKIFYGRLRVEQAASAFYFNKDAVMQQVLRALKYRNNPEAGWLLGKLMGVQMLQSGRFTGIDVIVPIPLNRKKLQQRGYNQAALLAQGMAAAVGWAVNTTAVERRLFTATQTQQNRINRWQNMQDAFVLNRPNELHNKHVLLVDDVITTGATLEACGRCLLNAPGSRLSIAAAAYSIK